MCVVVGRVMQLLITNKVCHNECDVCCVGLTSRASVSLVIVPIEMMSFYQSRWEVEWYYRSYDHALAMQWPLCIERHICGYLDCCDMYVRVLFLRNPMQWSVFTM